MDTLEVVIALKNEQDLSVEQIAEFARYTQEKGISSRRLDAWYEPYLIEDGEWECDEDNCVHREDLSEIGEVSEFLLTHGPKWVSLQWDLKFRQFLNGSNKLSEFESDLLSVFRDGLVSIDCTGFDITRIYVTRLGVHVAIEGRFDTFKLIEYLYENQIMNGLIQELTRVFNGELILCDYENDERYLRLINSLGEVVAEKFYLVED